MNTLRLPDDWNAYGDRTITVTESATPAGNPGYDATCDRCGHQFWRARAFNRTGVEWAYLRHQRRGCA